MIKGKKQLKVLFVALISALLIIIFLKFDASYIKEIVLSNPKYTYAVFFGIFFISSFILLPITPLTILAVSLIDPLEAWVIISSAAILGSIGPYFLTHYIGRDFVHKELEKKDIHYEKLDHFLEQHGIASVFVARILPILPFSVWNYLLGLSSITFIQYLFGTILGVTFAEALYIYIIKGFVSFTIMHVLVSIFIIAIISFIVKMVKLRYDSHKHK